MNLKVTCAIIVDGNRFLCAQRGPEMALPLQWEFPGGKIEAGESAENCIRREIMEELNLEIEILEQAPSAFHSLEIDKMLELIPFVCIPTGGELQLREHAQVVWCSLTQMDSLQWAEPDLEILEWWRANSERIQKALGNA